MGKQVAILMGSQSDLDVMQEAGNVLKSFDVTYTIRVLSAHRTPKETVEFVEQFEKDGGQVFICGAGMSAALSGVVAAHTALPVIGVPLDASPLSGMDALLSTVQMPPGVPVGSVAIGKAGAKNAGFLAVRMIGLADAAYQKKLVNYREEQRKKILDIKI